MSNNINIVYIDQNGNEIPNNELLSTKDVFEIAKKHIDDLQNIDFLDAFLDEFVYIGDDHLGIGRKLLEINEKTGRMYIKRFIKKILEQEKQYTKNYFKKRMKGYYRAFGFNKKYKNTDKYKEWFEYDLYAIFGFDICEWLTNLGIFNFIFPNKKIKKRKKFCKKKIK